jgi:two-component system, NarL family, response regulator DevR
MMRDKTPKRGRPSKKSATSKSVVASPRRHPIRVFIADSHEVLRTGVHAVLAGESDLDVVGEAAGVDELLSEARRTRPDVVLLESRLTGGSDAEICKMVCAVLPLIRIILLGSNHDAAAFHQALETGVQGFVLKNVSREELVHAIHTVAKGIPYLCPGAPGGTFQLLREQQNGVGLHSGLQILSPQERRVIALIAEGHTNKEIAAKLVLSDKTVKNYIANMFAKLEIERRTQAVALYLKTQHHRIPMSNGISE